MPDPPYPVVPIPLFTLLARLTWKALPGTELGAFFDADGTELAFYLDAGERWALYAPTSRGLGPFLVTRGTAQGLIAGECIQLRATFEAGRLLAST